MTEQAQACDSFGNCAAVGVTAAAAQVEGRLPELPPVVSRQPSVVSEQPPVIAIAPTTLTTTHAYETNTVDVTGLVTGPVAIRAVTVAVGDAGGPAILSDPASTPPYTITWRFPWHLPAGPLPDGAHYTATATVTDTLGNVAAVTEALIVDVTLPQPVTLTLASNGQPIDPGATLRETSPDLALTWTPSSDGSGLNPYQAAWRFEDAYTTTIRTTCTIQPAGGRLASPAVRRSASVPGWRAWTGSATNGGSPSAR